MSSDVTVALNDGVVTFAPTSGSIQSNAMAGTMRALVNNMVQGVSKGFEKKLLLVGVGYRAQAQGDALNLTLGFSHPVVHKMPAGIKVETPTQTEILDQGCRSPGPLGRLPLMCVHIVRQSLTRAKVFVIATKW